MTALVADRLGLTVVGDFREQDIAAGGQGMPLTAIADALLFRDPAQSRLLIHLGGVSSVVWLPAGGRVQDAVAFEAGPCNRLLDSVIERGTSGRERFDPGGRNAVQGRCLDALVDEWAGHPFLQQKPPKSLPRTAFGADFVDSAVKLAAANQGTLQDLLCTLSHFVIRAIAASCHRWLPIGSHSHNVYLSGGGVRNGMLWRLLEHYVPQWELRRFDDLGVPPSARNATAAAILAALTLDGVPASTPGATGAVGRMLGRLTPGTMPNWGRCLRWMSEQSGEITHPYRAA
jgi:anhydro-N-acetylmuramic acid kinase